MRSSEEGRSSAYELEAREDQEVTLESYRSIASEYNDSPREGALMQELGRVDGGRQAWTVLVAGVIFEAMFWGKCDLVLQTSFLNLLTD